MKSFLRNACAALSVALLVATIGCSNGSVSPIVPDEPRQDALTGETTHCTWGLWQFTADPDAGTLDVVQVRAGNIHLNVLPFLEPPPLVNLTIESLEFNGNIIDADIGLRHPFFGLNEFTGFDVCGVLITNGTVTGYNDPDIVMAGNPEDTYLMNPDGYSPWWNPVNFPPNQEQPIFGYIDGLLGTPDAVADYNSTICGYKCFADDLAPNESLETLDLDKRCVFSAGKQNIRHYTIHIGDEGLKFNYAVDASWQFPEGSPPWDVPGSFSISANRPEAFYISVVETDNDLYYVDEGNKGGTLGLDIIAYDWQGPDTIDWVTAEWVGIANAVVQTVPTETTEYTGTYHFEFSGDDLISNAPLDIFTTVADVATYPPLGNICAYFLRGGFTVSDSSSQNEYEEIIFYCGEDISWIRDIYSIDPEGLTEPVKWTDHSPLMYWAQAPSISPDGKYVVYGFRDWTTSKSVIRRIDLETKEDISLSDDAIHWYDWPSWRHDSMKIVYNYGNSQFGSSELYTMDPDGSNEEPLTPTGLSPLSPTYTPDDEKIVFQSYSTKEMYFYDVATGGVTQYTFSGGKYNDNPNVSPDGEYIAWATNYSTSAPRVIYISPSDAWLPVWKIIDFDYVVRFPCFSPDGNKVVVDHGGFSSSEIAVYNLLDDTWQDITSNTDGDYMADWGVIQIFDD